MTRQELLRWIGVYMLIASINFHGDRCKLWEGGGATSKYLPSKYDLCTTGMSRNRFDDICAAANEDEDDGNDNVADEGGKGTQVLLELTEPWHHSGHVITANAYFASIESGNEDEKEGSFFIGNVKQCSRRFPMEVLWECHPCKARIAIGPGVNQQQDRQDRTCCHELGRSEPSLFYHDEVRNRRGQNDHAQAPVPAEQVGQGTAGQGHH